jgi:hypothetical protein
MPATAISGPPGNSSKVRGAASNLAVDVPFSQNPLRATVIGLGTVVAALALAVIGLLVLMAMRRRSGVKVGTRFPSGTSGQPYTYGTPYDEAESLRRSTDKQ